MLSEQQPRFVRTAKSSLTAKPYVLKAFRALLCCFAAEGYFSGTAERKLKFSVMEYSSVYATDIQGRQISFADGIWQSAMPCSGTGQVPHYSELPGVDGTWDFNRMSGCHAELYIWEDSPRRRKKKKARPVQCLINVECSLDGYTMNFSVQLDNQTEAEQLTEAINMFGDRLPAAR